MIKITKQQLLDVTCSQYYEKRIKKYWPKNSAEVSLCRFIKTARKLKILDVSIQWVIWKLDYKGWGEAAKRTQYKRGSFNHRVASCYLDLFDKNKRKQK